MMPVFCEDGQRCSVIFELTWGISRMPQGCGLDSKELPKAWVGVWVAMGWVWE